MSVEADRSLPRRLEALGYDAVMGGFGALPLDAASATGGALARALGPLSPLQRVARTGLQLAFPNLDPAREREILTGMWDNLGRLAAEFPHLHKLNAYQPDGRITVEGAEILDHVKASGRGAVLISGHFANWEVMCIAIVQRGVPCRVTYRPANNAFVDQRIIDVRFAYGAKTQAAKGKEGGMSLLRALAKGEAVAILNDQKYNEGVAAPFFGREVMTADGATRLARRFGCPLIPMSVKRTGGARFHVTVHEPLPVSARANEDEAVAETVAAINGFVEARVREAPEQWFWVHRRWPKPFYKTGAPVQSAERSTAFSGEALGVKDNSEAGST